jgi:hypothetical protein
LEEWKIALLKEIGSTALDHQTAGAEGVVEEVCRCYNIVSENEYNNDPIYVEQDTDFSESLYSTIIRNRDGG